MKIPKPKAVQDRINKAKLAIMRHPRFCRYTGVMACGKLTITTDLPTAATDGWNVFINPDFAASLTDPQLRLLLLHEQQHKAYRHMYVWRTLAEDDPQLANIAMDHFVNLSLIDMDQGEAFLEMPAVGIQPDPKYRGWAVNRIYADLKQNPPASTSALDEHMPAVPDPNQTQTDDPTTQTVADALKDMERIQAEEIDRALRQGEILAKRRADALGLNHTPAFGELLHPRVDWRKALREFVSDNCAGNDESTWRRPNRRYLGEDIYLPSMTGITMTRLAVLIDTSGSCFGTSVATRFLSELAAIVEQIKPTTVDVLYVDTQVAAHQTFEDGQFAVAGLTPRGGGGTNLPVAYDYLRAKRIEPTAMVVLTDGETPYGTAPTYPVLWALTSLTVRPPYGADVYVGE